MADIFGKVLVMIVGPSAIGKTTLMDEVARQNHDFAYVRSFTTRAKRDGEISHYTFLSRENARKLHENGHTITFFEHPTTGDLYGTTAESFPAKYNLLDTLSGSVAMYEHLDFAHTVTISVTADPKIWQNWFLARYPKSTTEAGKRLAEAKQSIKWSLENQTIWLKNREDELESTARKLIEIVESGTKTQTTPPKPREILALIESGLWREN